MQYTPKKESELSSRNLLEDGEYPFKVLESSEKASKSVNNPGKIMVALKLGVFTGDGDRQQWVFDNFADWFSDWKLRHFPYSCGRGDDYEEGRFDASNGACVGWEGWVKIGTEKDKNTGDLKNVVKDYVVKEPAVAEKPTLSKPTQKPADTAAGESDDVPF